MKKLQQKCGDSVEVRFDSNPLGANASGVTPEDFEFKNMEWADVVFTANIHSFGGHYTFEILRKASELGKFTHFDTDDLLTDLYPGHRLWQIYRDQKLDALTKACYGIADMVSCTQSKFAERIHPFVQKALVVIKNAIDFELPSWNLPKLPPRNKKHTRIGWVGGIHHEEDVKEFKTTLRHVNSRVGAENVTWFFHGRPPVPQGEEGDWQQDVWDNYERLLTFGETRARGKNIFFGQALGGEQYGAFYQNMDISIAPLQYNAFNDSKSEIKLMECGRYGVPLVASDVGCYNETIVNGETGYLLPPENDVKRWSGTLMKLCKDRKHREEIGQNLKTLVDERFDINKHVGDRLTLYTEVMKYKEEAINDAREQAQD